MITYNIYRDGVLFVSGISATNYSFLANAGESHIYNISAVTSVEGSRSVAVRAAALDRIAPPVGLTATGGAGTVSLTWIASSDTRVTGYRIYRDGIAIADTITTNYIDNTTGGMIYSYAVSTLSPTEVSIPSTPVSVMVAISLIDLGSDSIDTFESYAVGSLSTLHGGLGWGATGTLIDYSFNCGTETFEDYALGQIEWFVAGEYWAGAGSLTN